MTPSACCLSPASAGLKSQHLQQRRCTAAIAARGGRPLLRAALPRPQRRQPLPPPTSAALREYFGEAQQEPSFEEMLKVAGHSLAAALLFAAALLRWGRSDQAYRAPRSPLCDVPPRLRFTATLQASAVPVLVEWYGEQCSPCKMMAKVLEVTLERCGGRAGRVTGQAAALCPLGPPHLYRWLARGESNQSHATTLQPCCYTLAPGPRRRWRPRWRAGSRLSKSTAPSSRHGSACSRASAAWALGTSSLRAESGACCCAPSTA